MKQKYKDQIPKINKITDVVRWCLETGDTFPLEDGITPLDGCGWGRIKNDFPMETAFEFEETHWFNVRKKYFAEYCGVDQSQVSAWIAAGMPVRKDGRLNWWEVDRWLTRYQERTEKGRANGWHK